jgi:hypothetical protein
MQPTSYEREGPFWYAKVTLRRFELPARYAAPLPTDGRAWGTAYHPSYPPPWFIEARLSEGDEEMLARALAVCRAAEQSGADLEWLRWGPARALAHALAAPRVLAWTRDLFAKLHPVGPEVWRALVIGIACEAPRAFMLRPFKEEHAVDELVPLVDADGVPDEAIAGFFAALPRADEKTVWRDRVHAVLRRAAGAPWSGTFDDAAWAFVAMDDPRVVPTLIELLSGIEAGDPRRATLARVLRTRDDAAAKAALAGEQEEEPFWSPRPIDMVDANEAVRTRAGAAAEFLKGRPEAIVEVAAALECMALDSALYGFERRRALLELAELAHEEAVAIAKEHRDPVLEPVASPLRRFGTLGDLGRYLVDVGLLDEVGAEHSWSTNELLFRRTMTFEGKTSAFPNEHDQVLRTLAHLAGLPAGIVFEEIPPWNEDDENVEEVDEEDVEEVEAERPYVEDERLDDGYRLRAYVEGRVWEVIVEESNYYDVRAMLALSNTLCRDLGLDTRFVELPPTTPSHAILAAPKTAIARAVDDGVVCVV